MKHKEKVYLGDSVYAEQDTEYLILTTENGIRFTNQIYLEPIVLEKLLQYLEVEKVKYEQP